MSGFHRYSLTLTLLLIAERQRPLHHGFDEDIHVVIERAMDLANWKAEARADLYAQLSTALTGKESMVEMQRKISAALYSTEMHFRGK
jgi:hypothetical protein